jgi:hypothetical protein
MFHICALWNIVTSGDFGYALCAIVVYSKFLCDTLMMTAEEPKHVGE